MVYTDGSLDEVEKTGVDHCIYFGQMTEVSSVQIPLGRTTEVYYVEVI